MSTRATALTVTSKVFVEGERIPTRYTCDGENISPPLAWNSPSSKTACFVLILDDLDAPNGTFTHWIVCNVAPGVREIPENVTTGDLGQDAIFGTNGAGRKGYFGPCPPPGRPHHYNFTIYAVDQLLPLRSGAKKSDVDAALRGHVLAQGRLTGIHQR